MVKPAFTTGWPIPGTQQIPHRLAGTLKPSSTFQPSFAGQKRKQLFAFQSTIDMLEARGHAIRREPFNSALADIRVEDQGLIRADLQCEDWHPSQYVDRMLSIDTEIKMPASRPCPVAEFEREQARQKEQDRKRRQNEGFDRFEETHRLEGEGRRLAKEERERRERAEERRRANEENSRLMHEAMAELYEPKKRAGKPRAWSGQLDQSEGIELINDKTVRIVGSETYLVILPQEPVVLDISEAQMVFGGRGRRTTDGDLEPVFSPRKKRAGGNIFTEAANRNADLGSNSDLQLSHLHSPTKLPLAMDGSFESYVERRASANGKAKDSEWYHPEDLPQELEDEEEL